MITKENTTLRSSDFTQGYEKGYHSKDYTWEDGINYVFADSTQESEQFREGYKQGCSDRMRDEIQKWMC